MLVADLIEKVKVEIPEIRLVEIDITQNPEIAIQYRIMATPAIAINGKLEFMGVPKEEALRGRIAQYIKPPPA